MDLQESFFLSEAVKYLYMMFAGAANADDTEASPPSDSATDAGVVPSSRGLLTPNASSRPPESASCDQRSHTDPGAVGCPVDRSGRATLQRLDDYFVLSTEGHLLPVLSLTAPEPAATQAIATSVGPAPASDTEGAIATAPGAAPAPSAGAGAGKPLDPAQQAQLPPGLENVGSGAPLPLPTVDSLTEQDGDGSAADWAALLSADDVPANCRSLCAPLPDGGDSSSDDCRADKGQHDQHHERAPSQVVQELEGQHSAYSVDNRAASSLSRRQPRQALSALCQLQRAFPSVPLRRRDARVLRWRRCAACVAVAQSMQRVAPATDPQKVRYAAVRKCAEREAFCATACRAMPTVQCLVASELGPSNSEPAEWRCCCTGLGYRRIF